MGISFSDLQYFSASTHISHGILISEGGVAIAVSWRRHQIWPMPWFLWGEDFVPGTAKGIMLKMPRGPWWLNLIWTKSPDPASFHPCPSYYHSLFLDNGMGDIKPKIFIKYTACRTQGQSKKSKEKGIKTDGSGLYSFSPGLHCSLITGLHATNFSSPVCQ